MARRHRMTPARRAALRKAQLASAAKRRRRSGNSASKSVRRAARQRSQYAKSSLEVARANHRRRRNKRIDKKINKVQAKAKKKIIKQGKHFQLYTNTQTGGVYTTARGVKAYQKSVQIHRKSIKKINKLNKKKKRRR